MRKKEMGTLPLYERIYLKMMENIRTGVWEKDQKIPTENELCQIYEASRITIRRALGMLEERGYLDRMPGRGAFVRKAVLEPQLPGLYSFADMARQSELEIDSRLLRFERRECPEEVAKHLKVVPGTPMYFLERIRFQEKRPFSYGFSYILCSAVPGLTAEAIRKNGLYRAIQQLGGKVPDRAWETFQATLMDARTAKRLNLPVGSAVLRVQRLGYQKDCAMEYSAAMMRGDSIRYEIQLR